MSKAETKNTTYAIGELAEEFGVTSRALRLYEEEGLLDPRREGFWRVPTFSFAHYEYDRLIRRYVDLFNSDDVLVLPYELLRTDAADFLRRLDEFVDLPPAEAAAGGADEEHFPGGRVLPAEAPDEARQVAPRLLDLILL